MNTWRLALLGMRYYWRTQLGVVLGVMCASAVLVGALAVGDSVRLSLRNQALQRIGQFDSALASGDRYVTKGLADRIAADLGNVTCAPILQLPGVAASRGGAMRTGIVDVFGVDDQFFGMSSKAASRPAPGPGRALLNERLARQLGVSIGEEIVVRVEKPSLMPREATMATVDDISFALRVTVDGVLSDDEFGRFGMRASQVPPFNLFVSLLWLQEELDLGGRVNRFAINASVDLANAALRKHWTIADAELRIDSLAGEGLCELTSGRVFLDEQVVDAVRGLDKGAIGVFTYFINSLGLGDKETPYSMVSALGPLVPGSTPDGALSPLLALAPESVGLDQIVLNDWLARDLGAKVGDSIQLDYYVMGAELQLDERSHHLRVHSIVPLAGAAADPGLMPAFPGLAEAKSCRDWEPGIPVELERLSDADQAYWDQHRGTPKAFVRLQTGQALWSNRFGSLTAVRTTATAMPRLRAELPRVLEPAGLGLFFSDLRGPALAAGAPATDFGGLFLGLSMFLIIAALLLTAMLFVFGIEQRAKEVGALLSFGFAPKTVRRLFGREAIALATLGGLLGAGLGIGYAHAVIEGLSTLWRDAVGQTQLSVHVTPGSIAIGVIAAITASLGAIALTLRKAFRRPAVELLSSHGGIEVHSHGSSSRRGNLQVGLAIASLALAVVLVVMAGTTSAQAAGTFFGAGALVLLSALLMCRRLLMRLGTANRSLGSVTALGLANSSRRPGRSLAVIALLASGTFLVVAIQANRLEPPQDPSERASGTGGFALFGRSTLPVLRDLDTEAARDAYALDEESLKDVSIVPLRVRDGDDASCLNLSKPQNPRLVGVKAELLASRGAFRFTATEIPCRESPWLLLEEDFGPNTVPAIGDAASVAWVLHKAIGDSIRYRDEKGQEFDIRIVGTVSDSILQGNLIVAEHHLQRRFPSATGYRMFLIDAPPDRREQVAKDLTRGFEDIGLELTETGARLAQFQAVQNTYLSMFQLLGALGLLLGTVGLGVVVLRNVLERQGELAIARAVGFQPRAMRRLVWSEHGLLLALGLAAGVIASVLAVQPVVRGPQALPIAPMVTVIVGIGLSGAFWVWIASALATRGPVLDALRSE